MKIGVLALQGDFDAHRRRLEELGAEVVLVRKPEQLDEIDGLVLPGGESSTILRLLGEQGFEKLGEFVRSKPAFGTCAGAILLATEVENPAQKGLGAIDITVRRNAYGRQIDSTIISGPSRLREARSSRSTFALRASSAPGPGSRCWPNAMATRCWFVREEKWPPPFTRSSPAISASTRNSSSWCKTEKGTRRFAVGPPGIRAVTSPAAAGLARCGTSIFADRWRMCPRSAV